MANCLFAKVWKVGWKALGQVFLSQLRRASWPGRCLLVLLWAVSLWLLVAVIRSQIVPAVRMAYMLVLGWVKLYLVLTVFALLFVPSWGKRLVKIGVKVGEHVLDSVLALLGHIEHKEKE